MILPVHRYRHLVLAIVTTLVLGSLATTGGYAWYLRSAGHRRSCAAALSAALDLPADIGRVVPRSFTTQEYRDVVVWLPGRRDRALTCDRAVVTETPTPTSPNGYRIDAEGGSAEISTRTWLREDYRTVLESGLRPGFSEDGLQSVRFGGMNLSFAREQFRLRLSRASGALWYDAAEHGQISIACHEFNGHELVRPVYLAAQFSPREEGINVDRAELTVPRLPVGVLGLRDLMGVDVARGHFQGRLTYSETAGPGSRHLTVAGRCYDLDLREWSTAFGGRGWGGRAPEIELQELRLENNVPVRLRFGGTLADVQLGDLLATFGLESLSGEAALRVNPDSEISNDGVLRFVATGNCHDVSLEALTAALGWGRMSGTLRVQIDNLTIRDSRLESLDAEVVVEPSGEGPNWVEGELLRELVAHTLGVRLPAMLPERIEYTQMGVRLDVRDEVLRVFGTHGDRETAMVTLLLFGQEWPITEPSRAFDLGPWFDQLRARAAQELQQRLPGVGRGGPDDSPENTDKPDPGAE